MDQFRYILKFSLIQQTSVGAPGNNCKVSGVDSPTGLFCQAEVGPAIKSSLPKTGDEDGIRTDACRAATSSHASGG